jgi:hypothetical protein
MEQEVARQQTAGGKRDGSGTRLVSHYEFQDVCRACQFWPCPQRRNVPDEPPGAAGSKTRSFRAAEFIVATIADVRHSCRIRPQPLDGSNIDLSVRFGDMLHARKHGALKMWRQGTMRPSSDVLSKPITDDGETYASIGKGSHQPSDFGVYLGVGCGFLSNALVANSVNRAGIRPAAQRLGNIRQPLCKRYLPPGDARPPFLPFGAIGTVFKPEGCGKR